MKATIISKITGRKYLNQLHTGKLLVPLRNPIWFDQEFSLAAAILVWRSLNSAPPENQQNNNN